jgi:glyoxylase-like metal-dependent hydrolase (beta-lactamase superfamily II)
MRVVALHRDALVVTSRMWQTNAVLLRGTRARAPADEGGDAISLPVAGEPGGARPGEAASEAMLIDSPYFPDELEALPELARRSEFPVVALLATHADFDHVLGRVAFPELALGLADSTAARLEADPDAARRELGEADAEHYVRREAELALDGVQALPVPGRLELGDEELELHPAGGHTADGMAVLARHAGVLACGDYLSDVEIPMISAGGSIDAYRATLARLAPLVEEIEHTVPGHGSPRDRDRALRILDEDVEYLDALETGEERPVLPTGRDTGRQRAIHAANLATLTW